MSTDAGKKELILAFGDDDNLRMIVKGSDFSFTLSPMDALMLASRLAAFGLAGSGKTDVQLPAGKDIYVVLSLFAPKEVSLEDLKKGE